MKREEFLKKIALGMGVAVVTPMVVMAENDPIEENKTSMAIDAEAIRHFYMDGKRLNAADIMQLWRDTGILVYSSQYGNPPIVIHGKVELVDING